MIAGNAHAKRRDATSGHEPGSDEVTRRLRNLLSRLEKTGNEPVPRELIGLIDSIKKELCLLEESFYPENGSNRDRGAKCYSINETSLGQYHDSVLEALASLCMNVIMNARDIRELRDRLNTDPERPEEDRRIRRLLGNINAGCDTASALTKRENDILEHLLGGKSNSEIARELDISVKTVKNHLWRLYKKLGVENRTQLFNRIITA